MLWYRIQVCPEIGKKNIIFIIFSISGKTSALYRYNLFSNIFYTPKIANVSFLNFGQVLPSQVQQLHYNIVRCRTKEIRLGCFCIRQKDGCWYFLPQLQNMLSNVASWIQLYLGFSIAISCYSDQAKHIFSKFQIPVKVSQTLHTQMYVVTLQSNLD